MSYYPPLDKNSEHMSRDMTPSCPSVVVQNQPVTAKTPELRYGPHQMTVLCPYCHNTVLTSIEYSTGLFSYVSSLVIMAMGCVCGCCLIPCCSEGFKNAEHTCPKCKQYLGIYHRM